MKEKEEKWTVYNSFPCLDIWIGKSVTKDRKNDQMHCYFLHLFPPYRLYPSPHILLFFVSLPYPYSSFARFLLFSSLIRLLLGIDWLRKAPPNTGFPDPCYWLSGVLEKSKSPPYKQAWKIWIYKSKPDKPKPIASRGLGLMKVWFRYFLHTVGLFPPESKFFLTGWKIKSVLRRWRFAWVLFYRGRVGIIKIKQHIR